MTIAPEGVTLAGSGLVFVNYYGAGVTDAYRSAVLGAEHQLQGLVTNPFTITVDFELGPLSSQTAAQNAFSRTWVSYATLTSVLRSHATTTNDLLAVNGLPAFDPTSGHGFAIPIYMAEGLGLMPQTNGASDLVVTLNSNLAWSYGQDAIGALEHELTEGGFGRFGSLGLSGDSYWSPLDLFRFTSTGQRDYTGGSDGQTTYFGLDSFHVSSTAYHNAISPLGVNDGADLGDWEATYGDAFGPGGPGAPGWLSTVDRQVIDVLGWSSTSWTPPADDYASALGDTAHPYGQVAVGSSAVAALQSAGDRDWFQVTLQAGSTYTIDLVGAAGGGGTLPDPYLRLHDAAGGLLAANDDRVSGVTSDSELTFTAPTSGTYYIEAGAFLDGYTGSYRVSVAQTSSIPGATTGADSLVGRAGGDSIDGLAGNDTIVGSSGNNILYGGDGTDSITGGSGFNIVNGNKGEDTIVGRSLTGDSLFGGQGNDVIDASTSSGHNVINGNLGNDVIHAGQSGDFVRGGQGDDQLYGGAGPDTLSGDRGHDTLTGGGGADVFHHFAGAGVSLVTDFNYAQGDRVLLDPGSQYVVSQSAADTVIDLGGGSQMILQNVNSLTLPAGAILLG